MYPSIIHLSWTHIVKYSSSCEHIFYSLVVHVYYIRENITKITWSSHWSLSPVTFYIVESYVKQYNTKPIKWLENQIILKSLGESQSKGL